MAKEFKLSEWLDKPSESAFSAFLAKELTELQFRELSAARELHNAAQLKKAKDDAPKGVSIDKLKIRNDGSVGFMSGKELSGYQCARIFTVATEIVTMLRENLAKGESTRIVEFKPFGGKKDDAKVPHTQYLFGEVVIATDKPSHVDFVKEWLAKQPAETATTAEKPTAI